MNNYWIMSFDELNVFILNDSVEKDTVASNEYI